jgi:5-methylthioadenosine/S-adenosylhomocysteine deaminase
MTTYYQPSKALIDNEIIDWPLIGVEDGRFTAIHRDMRSVPTADEDNSTIIRLDGRLMIPGLVNSQSHPFHVLMRGFIDDMSFYAWRERGLYRLALTLTPDEVFYGAQLAFAEMLQGGITTAVDFFYLNHKGNDFARAVINAAKSVGIRLVLARGLFDWQGGPDAFREPPALAIKNTADLMDEYGDEETITILPAPHSIHAASPKMLEMALQLAVENDSRLFIHVDASKLERDACIQEYGRSPVAQLHHLGLLSNQLTAVHATAVSEEEIAQLAESGATVVHTPSSELAVGSGLMRLREMLDAGVHVALGTDSPASNNRLSIFDELRLASLLQKSRLGRGDATNAEEIWPLATRGGASATGLPVGQIGRGCFADFCLMEVDSIALQPPQRLLHHLVYASPERALRAVYVAGRPVLENGEPKAISQVELSTRCAEVTRRWR